MSNLRIAGQTATTDGLDQRNSPTHARQRLIAFAFVGTVATSRSTLIARPARLTATELFLPYFNPVTNSH